ncbi:MAG: M28 family peptidase [Saprospiraceae bacterium]|nr:M28 family peptidase [Saprospiraceae bacterium]
MKRILLLPCLFTCCFLLAQNQLPVLSNVEVQRTGDKILTISYDLSDAEGNACTVSLLAGAKGAVALGFNTDNATGDLGTGIAPGTGKQITWDFSGQATPDTNRLRLMLVADDLQPVDIQTLVDQVDSTRLVGDLTFLEGVRHRTTGAAHLQETKDFLWFGFLDKGLETTDQAFNYGGYTAQNIMGRQPATSTNGDTYLLGGHFDTVDDAPGADDNGSAIAGMMEAMRILSQYPTKKSIKYIGFDLEEDGLIGSQRFVQQGINSDESILGAIIFEMIGYYTETPNSQTLPNGFNLLFPNAYAEVQSQDFRGNFITNVGKQGGSATLMQQYKTHADAYVPALRTINVEAPNSWQTLTPDLGRSDHAPFWVANTPAIMLTDGANFRNPNYHTPNDNVSTIDFTFMSNVVKGAVATLAQLAEVQHADSWWADLDFVSGVPSPIENCKLKLSPNPASGSVLVEWATSCAPQIQRLNLLDAYGRIVRSVNIELGKNRHTMDLNGLAKGNYYLKVESSQGNFVEKLVVR